MDKELILSIVEDSVVSLKFILLECAMSFGKTKDTLKVIIHHPQKSITSEDCSLVASIISRRLDIDDPFDKAYDLMVESPGVEREIKSPKEYPHFLGKDFKIFTEDHGSTLTKEGFFIGALEKITEEGITLKVETDLLNIPYEQIKKAKLYCDFNQILKKNKEK